MARTGWQSLLNVETTAYSTISLLERFKSTTEEDMARQASKQTPEEYNDAKNIYIVVWCFISSHSKKEMKVHWIVIGNNVPSFLWYMFK